MLINVTAADLARAAGGMITKGDPEQPIGCISLDSRSGLEPDGLFVPIPGAKTDGHRYIAGAAAAGAKTVIYSEDCDLDSADITWIRVEDTTEALQAFGRYLRAKVTAPVACVAGSVGKTTTREMTALALSGRYKTFCTQKNFNSQLGVPIMVSRIPEDAEAVVLEVGISEFHEMEKIAPVAAPDMTIYTNIGVSHIENLKTRENIFTEKFKLAQAMKPGSPLILNGDNDLLSKVDASCGYRILFYGFGENNDVRAFNLREEDSYSVFDADVCGHPVTVRLQMAGRHMVMNALAALAAAYVWDVPLEAAAEKLTTFIGFAGRQKIRKSNGYRVIEDFYNASPDSMKAALSVLSEMSCSGKRVAVLADMKELGEREVEFHREVGEYAADKGVSVLVCVGALGREIGLAAKEKNPAIEVAFFDNNKEAALYTKECLTEGDLVLLKGSNSMKLSEVSEEL